MSAHFYDVRDDVLVCRPRGGPVTAPLVSPNRRWVAYQMRNGAWAVARQDRSEYGGTFATSLRASAERQAAFLNSVDEQARNLVGGYYEDETGWWQVDCVDADGTARLIGRDGAEREVSVAQLPPLRYL